MKPSIKTAACVFAISAMFLSCLDPNDDEQDNLTSSSSNTSSLISSSSGLPVMSNKVISYKRLQGNVDIGFTFGKDTLETWFPHIFGNEQVKSECNYFAITWSGGSSTFTYYYILSQDMILYAITPFIRCIGGTADMVYHSMLICDDNEGNLKDKIENGLGSTQEYVDPNWNCESGEGRPSPEDVFF